MKLLNNQINPHCNTTEIQDFYMGYGMKKSTVYYFTAISAFGIIVNISFILSHIIRKWRRKKHNQSSRSSAIQDIFLWLTVSELLISISWLYQSIDLSYMGDINDETKCMKCRVVSHISAFVYVFDWILLTRAIYQYKCMIQIPISAVLNPNNIKKHLLFAFFMATAAEILISFAELDGISPMLTCLIEPDLIKMTSDGTLSRIIALIGFIAIPVMNLVYGIIQWLTIFCNQTCKYDRDVRNVFYKYSLYIGTYLILTALTMILYIADIFSNGNVISETLKWIGFIISLLSCSTPLIIGIIKFIEIYMTTDYETSIFCCCNKNKEEMTTYESLISDEGIIEGLPLVRESTYNEYKKTEKKMVNMFVTKIYITVCYCLEKSKQYMQISDFEINKNNCMESNEYRITKDNINNEDNSQIGQDKVVSDLEYFTIHSFEFCPKVFKYLRQIDNVSEEELINSFLPSKNRESIQKSAGRSGQLFIHSEDKKFILKTIEYEELELIRSLFVEKFAKYLMNNPNSMISRIYGVYKISMKIDLCHERELYFILMKNVFGAFNQLDTLKYDLKGSRLDRKVEFNPAEVEGKVFKDNNFREIEKVILLSETDSEKVRDILQTDAAFLFEQGIMDYSLLVVKMQMNTKEVKTLFGNNHFNNIQKEIRKIQGKEEPIIVQDEENEEEPNNEEIRFKIEDVTNIRKYMWPSLRPTNVYILAIIDFFQLYNIKKKGETFLKSFKVENKNDISSQPPKEYFTRFLDNLYLITDSKSLLNQKEVEGFQVIENDKQ